MKIRHFLYNSFLIESGKNKIAIDPGQHFSIFNFTSLIPKTEWKLHYVDSEREPATHAFDNDRSTFWHTPWRGSKHPHEIQIDLGAQYKIDGFGYQATWPANDWPVGGDYAGIPIDHALLTTALTTAHRSIGPAVGSDHLPLIVHIAPAAG